MENINGRWPVKNPMWDYKRFSLRKYLLDLNVVEPYDMSLSVYDGIEEFYIRMAYGLDYKIVLPKTNDLIIGNDYIQRYDESMRKMEYDPWNRPFKCFPHGLSTFTRLHGDDRYDFRGHYILEENKNDPNATVIKSHYKCYVITTTIEGEVVYCLDLFTK